MFHSAIWPSLALIAPVEFTWNPLDDITKFEFTKCAPECPLPLKKKVVSTSSAPLNIDAEPMVNPPICPPACAVIVPCIITLPSLSKWKLLELISKLSLAPLTKVFSPPKKKLDELITMFPLLPLINCPSLPKKNWSVCTVNSEGFVLNFKNLWLSESWASTISNPTPS